MRASQFFLSTLKEAPSDAEIVSHKLMLRAGLVKRLAGGVYTWMPLGLRALRKVIPPLRLGGISIDLSFMVLFFAVYLLLVLL